MTGSNVPWPMGPQAPVFFQGWHPFATDQLAAGFAGAGGAGVIRVPAFPDMESLSRRLTAACHPGKGHVGLDLRGVLGEFSARLDSAAHNLAAFLIHESDLLPERLEALRAWGLPRMVVVRDGEEAAAPQHSGASALLAAEGEGLADRLMRMIKATIAAVLRAGGRQCRGGPRAHGPGRLRAPAALSIPAAGPARPISSPRSANAWRRPWAPRPSRPWWRSRPRPCRPSDPQPGSALPHHPGRHGHRHLLGPPGRKRRTQRLRRHRLGHRHRLPLSWPGHDPGRAPRTSRRTCRTPTRSSGSSRTPCASPAATAPSGSTSFAPSTNTSGWCGSRWKPAPS